MNSDSFDSEALSGDSSEERETKNQSDKEKGKNEDEEENEKPQLKNQNLIKSISKVLTTILEENKKIHNYKEIECPKVLKDRY